MARRLGRPVIAFGGRVEDAARAGLRICFDEIVALSDVEPELTQKERMAREPELLCRHGARLADEAVELQMQGFSRPSRRPATFSSLLQSCNFTCTFGITR
jgi:hypothetical protein